MQSAFAKLGRAKVHRDVLDADVEAYRDREPHDFTYKTSNHLFDESQALLTYRLRVKEEPPSDWGLIVGDILTNLRAALDHAVFGHADRRMVLTPRQEKELNYPIIPISTDWPSHRNRLTQLMDPNVLNVIEQSQPYHDATPGEYPLAVLNSLVNQDKHRSVRVVSYIREKFEVATQTLKW
jgi:hypothetical protein